MVHDVIDKLDVHGFVVQPRLHHVLEACALPGYIAARVAIVNLVLRNHNVGRAACVGCQLMSLTVDVAHHKGVAHGHMRYELCDWQG